MTLLVEYKFFEPAFFSTDLPDRNITPCCAGGLDHAPKVLVEYGPPPPGDANIEQIVARLLAEDLLGGFHFNNCKYADDDLIVGSGPPLRALPDHGRAHDGTSSTMSR